MKNYFLSLIVLLLVPAVHASGCFPWDVVLQQEQVLTDIGDFKADLYCDANGCSLATSNSSGEYHSLYPQTKSSSLTSADLGTVKINIYRQYFVSSCSEEARYILGVDINGIRYREVNDLTEL